MGKEGGQVKRVDEVWKRGQVRVGREGGLGHARGEEEMSERSKAVREGR